MAADANIPNRYLNRELKPYSGRAKDLIGGPHGPKTSIFNTLLHRTPDYDYFEEDFQWESISATTGPFTSGNPNAFTYAESNMGATDPAKLTPTEADPSAMALATSANAYAQSVTIGTKRFTANCRAWFEARLKVSQVTDFSMVIGFADAIAASAGAVVSDIDTPAVATVADGAFYAIDISQTLKTAALVVVGTSTAVSKVNVAPTAAPFGVPTASTYFIVRVELRGDQTAAGPSDVYLYINDYLAATARAAGPDSANLMLPVFWHKSNTGTALTTTIDYVRGGQQKALSPF